MKKKKLLGKIVSLVLAAALTVTALPTTGMEAQAAEQVTTEAEVLETAEAAETSEDESTQAKSEEESEEAQSTEEEKASKAEGENEKQSSEAESETEEKSSEAESEKTSSESEEASQEQSDEEDLGEVVGNMDVNLHVYNGTDGGLGYDVVYLQYWQAGTAEITNATEEYFESWKCNRYKLTSEGDDWYGITIKGSMEGFNFLDDKGEHQVKGYEGAMAEFKGNLWYKNGAMYKEKECTTRLSADVQPPFLLVGTLPGTDWNEKGDPNFAQEGDTGKYSITIEKVPAGTYEYQILQNPSVNGWNKVWGKEGNHKYELDATADLKITIDTNDATKAEDIQKTYVKDIVVELPKDIKKGTEVALPATGTYYVGDGTKAEKAVTYKVTAEGASITEDGKLKVDAAYVGETVTFTAVCEGFEKEFTINVVEAVYKYTIYYYNPEYNKDTLDLWLWNKEGAGATEGTPFTGEEVLEDGNTWIKAELELSYTSLGIIPRSKGTWDYKDNERCYINKTGAEESTLYIVVDDQEIYTTLPEIKTSEKRYLIVEYKRNNGSAQNWCFYTWNNGFGNNFYPFVETNGSWIATIPVKPGISTISYCIERDEVAEDGTLIKNWAEKDGTDYTCAMPEDQTVVKVVQEEGKGITKTYPYNVGYELAPKEKKIHFYYRNNEAFLEDKANKYASVAVEVNGTEIPMTFSAEDQRYSCDLENLEPGTFKYRYAIKETAESDKAYELDRYNEKKVTENNVDYSVVEYGTFIPVVSASVYRDSMDYNDNNVLTVKIDAEKEENIKDMEVAEAYADLSELGGSNKVAIVPELLELTIAVKQGVAAGEKKIPVTIYDQFNNEYTTETTVTVTDRNKGADFDWDEAVIYFAVTDRFFDGNESNNGNGYDKSDKGSLSYHGGDFAGLTQKLDYLKELGVNTIWITPIVDNSMEKGLSTDLDGVTSWGYHGYWASNLEKLDSHLGTEEEFSTLLDEAHNRGMKIMVDVVLNHTGYEESTKEYYNTNFKDADGNPIRMLRNDDEMVSGSDQKASLAGLPDFLTENKEVRELLVEWQSNWISKYPIDYYRVDTVKHVDDTTWSAFKNALTKINPQFKMIGEWAGAGYATDAGALRAGRMDSLLDFDFNDKAQSFVNGDISGVESFLQGRNAALDNTATLGQFMSSHDEDGLIQKLISQNKMSEDKAKELFKVAATLQITAKGQPVIYYGEEIGLYGADNYPYQTNRYDFDWTKANDGCDMLTHYKKLLAVRNRYSEVLAKGTRETVAAVDAEGIDVFKRAYNGTTLTVALNISDTQKSYTVEGFKKDTTYTDCYSGKRYVADADGKINITIPAAADGGTAVLIEGGEFVERFYVADIADQVYTGNAIKLSADQLKVYYGLTELKAGTDYTVKYAGDTKNVGKVTVKITGKGNYADKPEDVTFNIVPKSVTDSNVEVDYQAILVKTGKEQKPLAKITYNNKKLGAKDYTVEYYKLAADGTREGGEKAKALTGVSEAGNYEMVITGKGNFTGVDSEIITVKETGNLMSKAKITLDKTSYVCDGTEHRPTVTVKFSGKAIAAENYTVEYKDNVNAGTAKVIITGIVDKGYYGSVTKTFKINGQKLSSVAKVDEKNWKVNVDIDVHTGVATQPDTVGLVLKSDGTTPLVSGTDYTVSYQKNDKPGTASMVFTGTGKYTGTIKKTFKINKIALSDAEGSKFVYTVAPTAPYGKKGAKAAVSVSYDGVALVEGKDYKLTFKNNKNVGDKATVTINGTGAYTQKVDKSFTVDQATFADVTMTVNDVVFVDKAGKFMATPVITDASGAKLENKKDYTLKYYLVNADGTETEKTSADKVASPSTIKIVATTADTTNYKTENNMVTAYYNVVKANIGKAKFGVKAKVYTGKAITLDQFDFTTAKIGDVKLILGEDFEIVAGSYVNNIKKGTASVTIRGIGNYTGTKKVTFKITSRTMAWWWNLIK